VLFVIFGIAMSVRNFRKAQDYRQARRRYEADRARIMNEEG
jgi:hypothetical protein